MAQVIALAISFPKHPKKFIKLFTKPKLLADEKNIQLPPNASNLFEKPFLGGGILNDRNREE